MTLLRDRASLTGLNLDFSVSKESKLQREVSVLNEGLSFYLFSFSSIFRG